ncbi:ATP-binding protein [Pokkaliibacter sp. MBI-7]|uniref:ATP-binding protein n=1 Tax=Pokkaliibacter sp. MBI-7 TaxID=3040600 RepID=UPI0024486CB6|nr:ATP-binding protein [Pokkaliibacter sp. MBI-7]MDH2436631.1 ATP-binding protein [Pokkaliibacter sp. MBI-7]
MQLPFELDPQIIHHIIYSQAGSIGKAIIELLMNSVDAKASTVTLTLDKTGFRCRDDGAGFASREDVIQYFGRFGTPHVEGDATFGRFRLGRGQIMAHARTIWRSNGWQMRVDTRTMGYHYDLEQCAAERGCAIEGDWYDPLSEEELMSTIQEIRDLVRYTPIQIVLNERVISRDPRLEQWDYEDDMAYYRVRDDGAVGIYNLGVLVRHDPGHVFGAGGLIVSKQAIDLNVSRTEILRKSCPVWKKIAAQFGKLTAELTQRSAHRKTESRREQTARQLMSGHAELVRLYHHEEVITLLPGKRHVSLAHFLRHCWSGTQEGSVYSVASSSGVPRGEAIASAGICTIVHPQTLTRFGCYNDTEFQEVLVNILHLVAERDHEGHLNLDPPALLDFKVLHQAFVERTQLLSEKSLDKETRRAWVALRWCLVQYARLCTGYANRFHIVLGESSSAEAWTDGESYIAIDRKVVQRLKGHPLQTAAYIFNLVEHELAHEGDSMDCGHDEAFYQRFHDLTITHSQDRQRHLHQFLRRYTDSMTRADTYKPRSEAWRGRHLVDLASRRRQTRDMSPAIESISEGEAMLLASPPDENLALITQVNARLQQVQAPPPDWHAVLLQAQKAQVQRAIIEQQQQQQRQQQWEEEQAAWRASNAEFEAMQQAERTRLDHLRAQLANIPELDQDTLKEALDYWECMCETPDTLDEAMKQLASQPWAIFWPEQEQENEPTPESYIPEEVRHLLQPGETWWSIQRNAAAAGFYREADYLRWREQQD